MTDNTDRLQAMNLLAERIRHLEELDEQEKLAKRKKDDKSSKTEEEAVADKIDLTEEDADAAPKRTRKRKLVETDDDETNDDEDPVDKANSDDDNKEKQAKKKAKKEEPATAKSNGVSGKIKTEEKKGAAKKPEKAEDKKKPQNPKKKPEKSEKPDDKKHEDDYENKAKDAFIMESLHARVEAATSGRRVVSATTAILLKAKVNSFATVSKGSGHAARPVLEFDLRVFATSAGFNVVDLGQALVAIGLKATSKFRDALISLVEQAGTDQFMPVCVTIVNEKVYPFFGLEWTHFLLLLDAPEAQTLRLEASPNYLQATAGGWQKTEFHQTTRNVFMHANAWLALRDQSARQERFQILRRINDTTVAKVAKASVFQSELRGMSFSRSGVVTRLSVLSKRELQDEDFDAWKSVSYRLAPLRDEKTSRFPGEPDVVIGEEKVEFSNKPSVGCARGCVETCSCMSGVAKITAKCIYGPGDDQKAKDLKKRARFSKPGSAAASSSSSSKSDE